MSAPPARATVVAALPAGFPAARLAISSWCWAADYYAGRLSLLDLPARAAALGYDTIELNDFMLPPPRFSRVVRPVLARLPTGSADLWRYRTATLRSLKARLAQHHVRCAGWTLNTDFTTPAPARRLYHARGVGAANALGAAKLRIILGGSNHTRPPRATARRVAAFVAFAAPRLPRETEIVLENHWGVSSRITDHLAVFAAARARLTPAQRERFGLCLDPVNMRDADRAAAWRWMAPLAKHVHLKWRVEAAGGPAAVDVSRLVAVVQAAGYAGDYVVEGAPPGS